MKAWAVSVLLSCPEGGTASVTFTVKESREDAIVQAVSEALAAHKPGPECRASVTMTLAHEIAKDVLRSAVSEVCRGEEE